MVITLKDSFPQPRKTTHDIPIRNPGTDYRRIRNPDDISAGVQSMNLDENAKAIVEQIKDVYAYAPLDRGYAHDRPDLDRTAQEIVEDIVCERAADECRADGERRITTQAEYDAKRAADPDLRYIDQFYIDHADQIQPYGGGIILSEVWEEYREAE